MDIGNFKSNQKFNEFNFTCKGIFYRHRKIRLDVIVNSMHGINGEDGFADVIAKLFDIPFVGSGAIQSAVLMDKHYTYALLKNNNIATIPTKFIFKDDEIKINEYPVIVKPARLGSSIGIKKISNADELAVINEAFTFDDKVVVQPFITDFKEYNQSAYMYQGEVILSNVEEVYHHDQFLSFEDKYTNVKVGKKHSFISDEKLLNKISLITKKVYKLFELSGVVRVDFIEKNGKILLNEINTIPGSYAYYLFDTDISILLDRLIYEALKNHQNKRNTVFLSSVLDLEYNYKK